MSQEQVNQEAQVQEETPVVVFRWGDIHMKCPCGHSTIINPNPVEKGIQVRILCDTKYNKLRLACEKCSNWMELECLETPLEKQPKEAVNDNTNTATTEEVTADVPASTESEVTTA